LVIDTVVLGPNSVIDLPEGASFQFVEIQARSLAEYRVWLESLDQGMRHDSLLQSQAIKKPSAMAWHYRPLTVP